MRKTLRLLFVLFFLVTIWLAQTSAADQAEESNLDKSARNVHPDFFVPDSPAFSVLGVTPENVIRPESTRDFAMALLNGVDPKGNLQTGIAIDTAPYLLKGVDLPDYKDDPIERFLTRAQLSLATTKGGGDDDKSVKASVGLRLTLFDYGDPRMDEEIYNEFRKLDLPTLTKDLKSKLDEKEKLLDKGGDKKKIEDLDKEIADLLSQQTKINQKKGQDLNKEWTDFLKEKEKGRWNASSATIGFAPLFLSEKGEINDLESEGFTVYATLSYGFEDLPNVSKKKPTSEKSASNWLSRNTHLLLHARYADGEKEALSGSSGFREQDTLTLGAQLRFQGPTIWAKEKGGDFAFGFEADYVNKDFDNGGDDELWRYTGIIELKPFKDSGLTLKISVGGESGNEDEDSSFVISTINWAMD